MRQLLFCLSLFSNEAMIASAQDIAAVDNPLSDFPPTPVFVRPNPGLSSFLGSDGVVISALTSDDAIYWTGPAANRFSIRFGLQCTNGNFKDIDGNDIGESMDLTVETFVPEGTIPRFGNVTTESMMFRSDTRTFMCNTNKDIITGSLEVDNATIPYSVDFSYRGGIDVSIQHVTPFMGDEARFEFLESETGQVLGSQTLMSLSSLRSAVFVMACNRSVAAVFPRDNRDAIGNASEPFYSLPGGSLSLRFRMVDAQDEEIREESDFATVYTCSDTPLPDLIVNVPAVYAENNGSPVTAIFDSSSFEQQNCPSLADYFVVAWLENNETKSNLIFGERSEIGSTLDVSCVDGNFEIPFGPDVMSDVISIEARLICGEFSHSVIRPTSLQCLDELPSTVENSPERIVHNLNHSDDIQDTPAYYPPASVVSDVRATSLNGTMYIGTEVSSAIMSDSFSSTIDAFGLMNITQSIRCTAQDGFVSEHLGVLGDQYMMTVSFGRSSDDIIFRSPEFVFNCMPPEGDVVEDTPGNNSTMVDDTPDDKPDGTEESGSGDADDENIAGDGGNVGDENAAGDGGIDSAGTTVAYLPVNMIALLVTMMLMQFCG